MGSLVATSTVAFAASLLLTAVVRSAARRHGIVDLPDGQRKLHGRPIPLWGGVAVYGATVLGLFVTRWCFGATNHEFVELSNAWMLTAGFVCFVGSVDDRYNLKSRIKLALQILAVLPLIALGYYVDRIVVFGCPIELGWLGVPLTVLWLVGCINALNLIDGMDGLASIVGLSTTVMMGVIAASEGHPHVAAMAIVLAAALAGFLTYNLPPASIFLGDSGSMVIGLSVGVLGMQGTLKTSATLAITAPAVAMTLPMFDIVAAIVRRRLTGRRFDAPDRLHIHHRLLDRGWTPWQVLCLMGALCLTMGGAATAATIFRRDALAWIAAMTLIVLMIRLRLFGHDEFALAKGAVLRTFRTLLASIAAVARRWAPGSSGNHRETQRAKPLLADLGGSTDQEIWQQFLKRVRRWDVKQVEFRSQRDERPCRLQWLDPQSTARLACGWSLAVSMPSTDGAIYELRAAGLRPIRGRGEMDALTGLLKIYGVYFAAHAEMFFGQAVADTSVEPDAWPDRHRKAA